MFSESKNYIRDFIVFGAGCLGIIWFFLNYKGMSPLSAIDNGISKEQILAKADSTMRAWQILPSDLKVRSELKSFEGIIDSLQNNFGTSGFIDKSKETENKNFPVYYWEIEKYLEEDFYNSGDKLAEIEVTPGGEIFSFSMSVSAVKNSNPYNIIAIKESMGLDYEPSPENRLAQDSLLNVLLDFQNMRGDFSENVDRIVRLSSKLGAQRAGNQFELFTPEKIWDGVSHYLDDSYWKRFDFEKDSLSFKESDDLRFARLFLTGKNPVMGLVPELEIDLLPAGGIKEIDVNIPAVSQQRADYSDIIEPIAIFIVFGFGLWLVSAFYLRIKARAIDTQPAFVIAVLAGFLFSLFQFLSLIKEVELSFEGLRNISFTNDLFILGLFGAISAVLFFVLTSVSDSVTRQHWPEKLKAWDLARRGFFKNKPVGRAAVNGIAIAGVLVGAWVILVQLTPDVYISSRDNLPSSNYEFPSLSLAIGNILAAILMVISVFMIMGTQLYSLVKGKWIIPIVSGIMFSIFLSPLMQTSIYPSGFEFAIEFIIGALLGVFYINYGFLTIVCSLFVYFGFFTTSSGWVIANSPDANAFYFFVASLVTMSVVGCYFIIYGSEKKDLPDYVPSYIEEQAKGQRLDQELQIAQAVQRTFLPSRVEHLPGLDIAGTCEPAQETGGDYYDMISLGKNRMAIAIGDVSGKGIQAAFYMTFVKGVLHSLSALILSPLELLNQLNRLFCENATRGTFVSMIYGILESDKRTFTFVRAGHNPMLVIRNNGDAEWLQSKGVGIGVAKGNMFHKVTEEKELTLKEGDVAVLYTDGITEMMNISNQFYGEERLEKLVKGVRKGASGNILDIITSDVKEFKGVAKQHDDMTLVVIKADSSVNK